MPTNQVLQATYHDGSLVLDERLDAAWEGKKLKIIVLEDAVQTQNRDDVPLEERKQNFLAKFRCYSFKLPTDYQFNREELYER